MGVGKLNVAAGTLLGIVGLGLAAAGPAAMPAFGVDVLPPASAAALAPAEWRLVAFARMFGMALFLCGAVLFIVGQHIPGGRARLFSLTMAIASALVLVMTVVQQTAIWNTTAGAVLSAVFAALVLAYGWAAIRTKGAAAAPADATTVRAGSF